MPRKRIPVIERARVEIERGRLWKARDRLTGHLANSPADQAALDLLGEVLFEMGDLPAAGRVWFLTERADERAQAATAALGEACPSPAAIAQTLPARAELDAWPPAVRARLEQLAHDARADDFHWEPGRGRRPPPLPPEPVGGSVLGDLVGFVALAAVVVGPWLLGAGFAIYLALRALGVL